MVVNLFSLLLLIIVFVVIGHRLAKRKGLKPVFWGVMGGVFGPLILPILLLVKSKHPPAD